MSLQIAILKVLSSYPDGRASVDAMKADLAILNGCRDWTDRMKRLAARAPGLDIFSHALVLRDGAGWQLTATGRAALSWIEAPDQPKLEVVTAAVAPAAGRPRPSAAIIDLHGHRLQRRRGVALDRSA